MFNPIDINKLVVKLLSSDKYLRTMEEMNRKRLYDTGKDTHGKDIETFSKFGSIVYAYYTIYQKQKLGLPTDRVTGFQTGKLHQSIIAKTTDLFIDISADQTRLNLFLENIATDHENILGLSKEDIDEIVDMLIEDLPDKILEEI